MKFFLLIGSFLASSIAYASPNSFTDVTMHSFNNEIQFVKDAGIISGYADGTYRPNNTINRAEFIKIIITSLYPYNEIASCDVSKNNFVDVLDKEWFAKYICVAKKNEIINGYGDGTFKPSDNITLPESIKILLLANDISAVGYGYRNISAWDNAYLEYFADNFYDDRFQIETTQDIDIESVRTHKLLRGEMAYLIKKIKTDHKKSSINCPLPEMNYSPEGCTQIKVTTLEGCANLKIMCEGDIK